MFYSALDQASSQQDYLWFLAILAWGAVAAYAWRARAPAGAGRGWILGLAAAGCAQSAAELALIVVPAKSVFLPRLSADGGVLLAVTVSICANVWGATETLSAGYRKGGRSLAVLALGGLVVVRDYLLVKNPADPVLGGWLWAAVGLGAALWGARSVRIDPADPIARRRLRGLAMLAGCWPLLATVGPLAEVAGEMRRWSDLSRFGLPSAALSLGTAWCAAGVMQATGMLPAGRSLVRDGRWLVRVLVFWLVAGLMLAWGLGRLASRAFERSLLVSVASAASMLDARLVADCLQPAFRLEVPENVIQRNGRENPGARAPFLLTAAGDRLRAMLTRVERGNPEALWAHLMTIRQGLLISYAFAERMPGDLDFVPIHRAATPADEADWTSRRAGFEAPIIGGWGELVRARAPVLADDGRMLGWLAVDYPLSAWTTSQAQARLQTFGIVGLGVWLVVLFHLHRLRVVERENALQSAAIATEASRAKTGFLAQVSHELRTPIQSILGYAELLRGKLAPGVEAEWLAHVQNQAQSLLRLVNDLLDLSALQTGAFQFTLEPGLPASTVGEAVAALLPAAQAKKLELACVVGPGPAAIVDFDRVRLRQIVTNLVGNAVKFTARGGVRVHFSGDWAVDGTIWAAELRVVDTGPGIPPPEQAALFQPFKRLAATSGIEGTGLGLALSRSLCRGLGGDLTVESDGRTGTTFVARFLFRAPRDPAAVAAAAAVPLSDRRVLVVDDNRLIRELFVAALTARGARCDQAEDGDRAVAACVERSYDTVVLDVAMPGLDGLAVARLLRARPASPSLRLVGVSAHAREADRKEALAAGMDVFLVKPVALEVLVLAVAGGNQVVVDGLPNDLPAELKDKLWRQFSAEVPEQLQELAGAVTRRDWARIARRAHYLANSTDAVRLRGPADAARRLEQAALQHDSTETQAAFAALHAGVAAVVPALPSTPLANNRQS